MDKKNWANWAAHMSASKTPRAAAAKASASISKKAKVDSDSDFEQ
jgi:hypothetical protein